MTKTIKQLWSENGNKPIKVCKVSNMVDYFEVIDVYEDFAIGWYYQGGTKTGKTLDATTFYWVLYTEPQKYYTAIAKNKSDGSYAVTNRLFKSAAEAELFLGEDFVCLSDLPATLI